MKEPTANILKESALTHKPSELALFLTPNEQTNVYLKKVYQKDTQLYDQGSLRLQLALSREFKTTPPWPDILT